MDEQAVLQHALDRANEAHNRLDKLETEVGNLQTLTKAVAEMSMQLKYVTRGVQDIKDDVKNLTSKPGQLQDKIISGVIVALISGVLGAFLGLILK